MRRTIVITLTCLCVLSSGWWLVGPANSRGPNRSVSSSVSLSDLFMGKIPVIDLTYPLNSNNAYWPGENYRPFELKTIATLEKDGVLSKAIAMPEHLGTHLDAPNHFEKNQPAVDQIPPRQLFGPAIMMDVTVQAEQDPDYQLGLADILAWEREHGRIFDESIVLLRTG